MFHTAFFLIGLPVQLPVQAMVSAPVELAQLTIEQRVIIRVPLARPPASTGAGPRTSKVAPLVPPASADAWEEKKGPRCIAVRSIRQAAVTARSGVDLILSNSQRYRVRLEKICRSVDFYAGFYIEPSADGSLCAGRDTIQSRSGTECEIAAFRRLVPDH